MRYEAGSRVGHLTMISDSGERKNGFIVWNCRCDCGNEIKVDIRTLKRGTKTDCGCISKLKAGQIDISGQRFGHLTALYPTGERGSNGSVLWHCRCDCGNETDVSLSLLRAGHRTNCGCLSHPPLKDFVGKRFGRLTVTAYAGKRDGKHCWKCRCDCGNETIVGQSLLQSGKTRSCGCIKAETYKDNLKLVDGTSVSILEGLQNGHLYSNNTSGCTGVYQNKRSGKWVAQIVFRGKTYYLGSYTEKKDAIEARREGEKIHSDFLDDYYSKHKPEQKKETA